MKSSLSSVVVKPGSGLSGDVRRAATNKDELTMKVLSEPHTAYGAFRTGLSKAGSRNCMGTRTLKTVHNKTTKKDEIVAGPFSWLTYKQCAEKMDQIGSAIAHLKLAGAATKASKLNGMIGLYSKNRYEWVIAEHGAFSQNLVTVPLYDTLGAEAVAFIINQTQMMSVFCATTELTKLLGFKVEAATSTEMSCLKNIVVFEVPSQELRDKTKAAGCTLYSFDELIAIGKANPAKKIEPSPDDICTICYTSGTTGNPKGAMLSHRNLVASAAGAMYAGLNLNKNDIYLSYLPLAHVFERLVQVALWHAGCSVGFFQGDALKLVEDLQEIRPTVFCSVPRLYNRFYDKIMSGAKAAGGTKAKLFANAYETKRVALANKNTIYHWLWDSLVFKKVAGRVGLDRCRVMATGSAPIAPHVLEFLRIVFRSHVVEGYGQTECGGVATVTPYALQNMTGNVGCPLPYNEVKLVSVPEMGYNWDDKLHGADAANGNAGIPCQGRGEVCYNGLNVFKGYYEDAEKTAEALDSEGWLHSGDIGLWDMNGNLKIVDRKKNIFKLSQGEYVAPEKIENIYLKSSLIAQVFVYGDSLHAVLVGVAVPNVDNLKAFCAAKGITDTSPAAIAANKDVNAAILADLQKVGKEAKLSGFEQVKGLHLEPSPWSPEDLLTPSFKLKRADAKKKYSAILDGLYDALGDTVAGVKGLKQG